MVAQLDRLVDVVGDEDDRLAQCRLEPQELVLESLADDRVDRPERLVHEQDRRVRGERPGDADALLLAAGELGRVATGVRRRVEPDELQQLPGALAPARRRPAQQPGDRRHVLGDRLVREETDLLDHVADPAAQLGEVAGGDVLAVDEDPAGRRLDEPVDHLQRRRLAAAGRADEDADLPGRDREERSLTAPGVPRFSARRS